MPHLVNRFGTNDFEEGREAANLKDALIKLGFEVSVRGPNSGLQAIAIADELQGGGDPRRKVLALGE